MRGVVGCFKRSTNGINDLKVIQADCEDPVTKPIQDVATRWRSAYDMANWFRVQQQSLMMFDIQRMRDADDTYKENRLGLTDWDIIQQSVAVLAPREHSGPRRHQLRDLVPRAPLHVPHHPRHC
jgi:hypothetical protein